MERSLLLSQWQPARRITNRWPGRKSRTPFRARTLNRNSAQCSPTHRPVPMDGYATVKTCQRKWYSLFVLR